MVSLDTMSGEDYISLTNEIIFEIDKKQPSLIQCRSEAPEQRVMRHLEFLKGRCTQFFFVNLQIFYK